LEKDIVVSNGKEVTVVVSRSVFPGREKDYDAWVHKMVAATSAAPGNTGVTILLPEKSQKGLYHLLVRFKDQTFGDGWEQSQVRQGLTAEADQFSRLHRQAASGLETWFNIPECPQVDVPRKWKQAVVTTIGVYLVSTAVVEVLGLIKLGWNFFLENILGSILVVVALTWLIMPFLTRIIFRKWLYK
jgi:uncharacterized protein